MTIETLNFKQEGATSLADSVRILYESNPDRVPFTEADADTLANVNAPIWGSFVGDIQDQADLLTLLDLALADKANVTDIAKMLVSDVSGITVVTANEISNVVVMTEADAATYEASGEYDPTVLIITTE